MKKSLVIAVILLLGVCITTASAVEVIRFGPKQYVRDNGKPQVVTDTFTASGAFGGGKLIVENGDENGDHRVTSAVIQMNGQEIFGPNAFNQQVGHLEAPLNLLDDNTLSVELRSKPDTFLTIRVTQEIPIEVSITSPSDGATVAGPDLRVQGTIINPLGNETGVNVNGIVAMVYDNQFVASHVPVQEGANTLTAQATDTDGHVVTTAITVNVVIPEDYITLQAAPGSGILPFETTLRIDGTFTFTESILTYTGPGEVQIIENPSPEEYRVQMTTEGVYELTAEVVDDQSNTYSDTVTVVVLSKEELDAMLQAKWDGMKSALVNQDIDKALNYFALETQELYHDIYTALGNNIPQIVQDMQDIQFIYAEGRLAKYRIRRNEEHGGQVYPITYYIYFVRDRDGLWKIYRY